MGGEGEKPLRVSGAEGRVWGEERGGEPMGPKSWDGFLGVWVAGGREESGRGEVGSGLSVGWGSGSVAGGGSSGMEKEGKSVSLSGGAGAEGEMVAFREGIGRLRVGGGALVVD